jgi:hypothetical protein
MFLRGMHTSNEMANMRLVGHAALREGILDTEVVRWVLYNHEQNRFPVLLFELFLARGLHNKGISY